MDSPDGVDGTGDQNDAWNNHIAIVAKIPDHPNSITNPVEYMSQMILIEGEFTNKIQSVIKKLNVGDYNRGNIDPNFTVSTYFVTPNTQARISLNCASWAIRRMR